MTPAGGLLFPSSIRVQVKGHPSREKNERSCHNCLSGVSEGKEGTRPGTSDFLPGRRSWKDHHLCVVHLSQVCLSLADGIIFPQGDF